MRLIGRRFGRVHFRHDDPLKPSALPRSREVVTEESRRVEVLLPQASQCRVPERVRLLRATSIPITAFESADLLDDTARLDPGELRKHVKLEQKLVAAPTDRRLRQPVGESERAKIL